MPNPEARVLTDYFLEQGGAAAGQQLIVPVATPWPPHHAMATDAAFGAPHMGANEASPVLVLHTCLLACLIAQVRRCGSSARAWSRARRSSSKRGLPENKGKKKKAKRGVGRGEKCVEKRKVNEKK